jgi:hypothetical protein
MTTIALQSSEINAVSSTRRRANALADRLTKALARLPPSRAPSQKRSGRYPSPGTGGRLASLCIVATMYPVGDPAGASACPGQSVEE